MVRVRVRVGVGVRVRVRVEAAPALGPRGIVGGLTHVHEVDAAREQRDVDEGGAQP